MQDVRLRHWCAVGALILSLVSNLPVVAQGNELQSEINAYNQGDCKQAIERGRAILGKNPENDVARYYLALAYYRANQFKEAEEEYSICAQKAKNQTVKVYAQKALENLKRAFNSAPNTFNAATGVAANQSPGVAANQSPSIRDAQGPGARLNTEYKELLVRIQSEWEAERDRLERKADEQINQVLQQDAQVEPRRRSDDSRDSATAERPRSAVNEKIQRIRTNLAKDLQRLWSSYSDRATALNSASNANAIKSQLLPGKSDVQLAPEGLSLYAKNYVNYAADPLPQPVQELRATAKSLSQVKQK